MMLIITPRNQLCDIKLSYMVYMQTLSTVCGRVSHKSIGIDIGEQKLDIKSM